MFATLPVRELLMLFSGWLNTSGGRMKLAWMEMSNIGSNQNVGMTRGTRCAEGDS